MVVVNGQTVRSVWIWIYHACYVMKTEKQLLYVFLLVNVVAIEVALFVRPKTTRCCSDVEAKGLITDVRTSTIAQ